MGRKGNRQNLFVGIYLLDLRDCVIVIMGIHGLFQWQALDCCTVSGAVQIPSYLENPATNSKGTQEGEMRREGKGNGIYNMVPYTDLFGRGYFGV